MQVPVLHADVDMLVNDGAQAAARVESSVHANTLAYNVVPLLGDARRQRLHRRGDEAPEREPQDPRPAGARRQPDLRARAGDGRPRGPGARDASRARSTSPRRSRRSRRSRTSSSRKRRRRSRPPGRDETFVGRVRADLARPAQPQLLRRRRQPAQGRRAEHRAARRARESSAGSSARARSAATLRRGADSRRAAGDGPWRLRAPSPRRRAGAQAAVAPRCRRWHGALASRRARPAVWLQHLQEVGWAGLAARMTATATV